MARPLPSPMARMAQARTARMEALDRATTARLENDTSSAIARYIAQYHPSNQIEMGGNPQMFAQQENAQAQARMGHQLMGHYQQMERQLLTDDLTRERMEEEYRLRDLVRRRAHWRGRGSKKDRLINRYEKYQSIATAEGNSAKGIAAKKKADQMLAKYSWIADSPRAIAPEELPREALTPREWQAQNRRVASNRHSVESMTSLAGQSFRLKKEIADIESLAGNKYSAFEAQEKYGDLKLALQKRRELLQQIESRMSVLQNMGGTARLRPIRSPTQIPVIKQKINHQTGQTATFNPSTNSWDIR